MPPAPHLNSPEECLIKHSQGDAVDQTIRIRPSVESPAPIFRSDIVNTRPQPGADPLVTTAGSSDGLPHPSLEITKILQSLVSEGDDSDPTVEPIDPHAATSPDQTAQGTSDRIEITEAGVRLLRPHGENYILQQMLGQGGQGIVFEAWQEDLQRPVAIKLSNRKSPSLDSFLAESMTVARLAHPNIVPIHGIGLVKLGEHTVPAIVMKRIHGHSWKTILAEDRRNQDLSHEDFLRKHLEILLQSLNALGHAHDNGIIHRDLKPAQVMVGERGEVYLGDWGLAVLVDKSKANQQLKRSDFLPLAGVLSHPPGSQSNANRVMMAGVPGLTEAANPAGSPAYMAPEQVSLSTAELCVQTDIYLTGAVLYELITGHPPHMGKTLKEVIRQAYINEYSTIPATAPTDLADLVEWCLASKPADRPSSLQTVILAIRNHLTGATRRSKGREIIASIEGSIASATTYNEISAVGSSLQQAASHDPEYERLPQLHDKFLVQFTRLAIAKDDLFLARIQLSRINDENIRSALAEELQLASEKLQDRLERPPLLTWNRLAIILITLLTLAFIQELPNRQFRNSISEEALTHAMSIADLASHIQNAADLDSIVRNPDSNSQAYQRAIQNLIPIQSAVPELQRFMILELTPIGQWKVLVDSGILQPEPASTFSPKTVVPTHNPGQTLEDLPQQAISSLYNRQPTAVLVEEDGKPRMTYGFAPKMESGSPLLNRIVVVEIPTTRLNQALARLKMITASASVFLGLLFLCTLLAIFHGMRSLEMVRRLREHRTKHESELKQQNLNLG